MAKDMFKKYIWIVNTLYSTGGITYKDLVKEWEKSSLNDDGTTIPKRTFDEYKRAIEDNFDINIVCDVHDGYKYKIEDTESLRNDPVKNWLLSTFSINNVILESRKLKKRILFEHIPSGNELLMNIIAAMLEGKCLNIVYQNFHDDHPKMFFIEPYCVKVFKQRWYMVAHSLDRDKILVYALDRILRLEHTDESFDFPETFDAAAYFYDCYGIMMMPEELDVEDIYIKVTDLNNKRKYFRLLPLHQSQREVKCCGDYSVFTYHLYPTYDFLQEILSHGAEVEVLSPDWVRKEFCLLIEDMCQVYKGI